jgi:hypothetical protein
MRPRRAWRRDNRTSWQWKLRDKKSIYIIPLLYYDSCKFLQFELEHEIVSPLFTYLRIKNSVRIKKKKLLEWFQFPLIKLLL